MTPDEMLQKARFLNNEAPNGFGDFELADVFWELVKQERERCAKIADEHAKARCDNGMTSTEAMRLGAESIAAIIRGTSSS